MNQSWELYWTYINWKRGENNLKSNVVHSVDYSDNINESQLGKFSQEHLKVLFDPSVACQKNSSAKNFSCLIKSSIGCSHARNYLLIDAVYVFDRN